MGIPSYFSHIVRNHRSIIKLLNSATSPPVNNLYLDCNSFIYEAVHALPPADLQEKDIIDHVCASLIKYIKLLKPDRRVLIAFDGVAPMAKLDQQRNRRYMTAFQNSLDGKTASDWSTSAITPGTAFMEKVGNAITAYFTAAKATELGLESIIVSTSSEPGEGEHKIYEYIREHAAYHQETSTVIYGLDADLIMLTLNHLHISEKLYLFRETPEFIKNIDKTLDPNKSYILDIPLFAQNIIKELSSSSGACTSLNNDILFDYIFLCFLLGNDFLPHFPALNIRTNGITNLINAYKFVFNDKKEGTGTGTLTKNREIIWKNVRKYIAHLAANELDFIKEEYVYRQKISKRTDYTTTDADTNLMLPLTERATELYINPAEEGWEARYYKSLFRIKIDEDRRKEIATNYLAGLEWTMKYYSTGCADWRWRYNYYYPPLLTDLIKYVPYFDHTFVPLCVKNPVLPLVQLCYVLPPASMGLLPEVLHERLLAARPDWYVGNYVFL